MRQQFNQSNASSEKFMMLKPDRYFKDYFFCFPAKDRQKARKLFRRAIREYYVMQRKYVIEPESGERVQSVLIGHVIKQQKKQRRKVRLLFTGAGGVLNFV